MEKLKKLLKYTIFKAIFAASLFYGFVCDIEGAKNLAIFIAWLFFVASLSYYSKDLRIESFKRGRTVPVWFDISFDVLVCGFLVWHGHVVTGIFYILGTAIIHANLKEAEKETQDKEKESNECASQNG